MIDVKGLASATVHGTLALAAGGYTGDGSTGYIDTGFTPPRQAETTRPTRHPSGPMTERTILRRGMG